MSSILFCGMYLRRLDSVAAVAPLDKVVDGLILTIMKLL